MRSSCWGLLPCSRPPQPQAVPRGDPLRAREGRGRVYSGLSCRAWSCPRGFSTCAEGRMLRGFGNCVFDVGAGRSVAFLGGRGAVCAAPAAGDARPSSSRAPGRGVPAGASCGQGLLSPFPSLLHHSRLQSRCFHGSAWPLSRPRGRRDSPRCPLARPVPPVPPAGSAGDARAPPSLLHQRGRHGRLPAARDAPTDPSGSRGTHCSPRGGPVCAPPARGGPSPLPGAAAPRGSPRLPSGLPPPLRALRPPASPDGEC